MPDPGRRARAAASTESSWRGSLTVPLASTTPPGPSAIANGAPGTRPAAHASGVLDLVEAAHGHAVAGERVRGGGELPAEPAARDW